eukprot:gnl/MRDRNA2_/MRDRNA2_45729_c0_seq1.p1 gnl/MRDRNA2_/MRDRNA2_45729_c0~~gnl/MRDRNA2_/MRDRNA2_45729_c0_seq1.p1  ORF type:complete len:165 (+),score=42.20 gnl/MRDRNA2_/MRDRNA2_45729_c0_seq1:35-496(+)
MDDDARLEAMSRVFMKASKASSKSVEVVAGGFTDPNRQVKDQAVAAATAIIGYAASDARQALLERLKNVDSSIKYDILDALVESALAGASKATDGIESIRVGDADPSIRMKAAQALSDVATRVKKNTPVGVRQGAAQAVRRHSKVGVRVSTIG